MMCFVSIGGLHYNAPVVLELHQIKKIDATQYLREIRWTQK